MANSEDVLERAIDWYCDDKTLLYHRGSILRDLIDHVRELRVKLDSEAGHRLSLCADNERLVSEVMELRAWRDNAVMSCAKRRCALRDREIEELRKDRELLVKLHAAWTYPHAGSIGALLDVSVDCGKDLAVVETRAEIDAAMAGGEERTDGE